MRNLRAGPEAPPLAIGSRRKAHSSLHVVRIVMALELVRMLERPTRRRSIDIGLGQRVGSYVTDSCSAKAALRALAAKICRCL